MLDQLMDTLIASENEAADDLLLEAVDVGNDAEQLLAVQTLIKRQTVHGLGRLILNFDSLKPPLQGEVMSNLREFHHALRECGRSNNPAMRLAAMKLIALGRQGKLSYVLSENLHNPDANVSKAATEAIVALARWISVASRGLAKADFKFETEEEKKQFKTSPHSPLVIYSQLIDQRDEIEQAVARALDLHRGHHVPDLVRAGLLLADWPGSKTLAIIQTARHGGQSPMVRRLQQPPASEHVEAFLLGASHGGLRSHFGITFSHIEEAPVLDALLRRTHWLKDHQLQLCMLQVTRGFWWNDSDMNRDIHRRDASDAAKIAEYLAVSGMHDVTQDDRMDRIREYAKDNTEAQLRLLRIAMVRKRGASVAFFRSMLASHDERLMRMAAREIVRRRPPDFENMLLQLMTSAPDSVRKVIARAVGQSGFETYWTRFDRLDRPTRKSAGRAMMKLLPDFVDRLSRRMTSGPLEHRLKALQVAGELQLATPLRAPLIALCGDANAKVRSKAICVLGANPELAPDVLIERLLIDTDPRVRANTIEILESRKKTDLIPVLVQRARSSANRERANAIKALHGMKVSSFSNQLADMLVDTRYEHRISALWTLRKTSFWKLLNEVVRMARVDENQRVRRYALGVLRDVNDLIQQNQKAKVG